MDYKVIISIITVILVFVGYGPYVVDILKKKTTPHTFTFLVWSIASSVTWGLQVYGGAGVGAWSTFIVSSVCIFIFLLSLKYGEKNITVVDVIFFGSSVTFIIPLVGGTSTSSFRHSRRAYGYTWIRSNDKKILE